MREIKRIGLHCENFWKAYKSFKYERVMIMKYSIIIPCYNEKDNIDNLLERVSVLQKNYNVEYILVENGSKDGSREYFRSNIEGRFSNVKVVYVKENRGYGYGLQQGMKIASGDYVGWIHADMQILPEELIPFFEEIEKHNKTEKLFLKGRRTNRSFLDRFFTKGQSIFNTCLFGMKLYDVGAIPVLFNRSLLEEISIDEMANDFSIELYVYKEAVRLRYEIIRFKVKMLNRENGDSSWNHGLQSKIRQSKRIFKDSLKIKRGEKVL